MNLHTTNRYQTCSGNSTEICGGPDRLNLYTRRQAPEGWSSLGCYTDSVNARTLASRQFPAGDLTPESCLASCRSAGFVYAGTEYGGECVCMFFYVPREIDQLTLNSIAAMLS